MPSGQTRNPRVAARRLYDYNYNYYIPTARVKNRLNFKRENRGNSDGFPSSRRPVRFVDKNTNAILNFRRTTCEQNNIMQISAFQSFSARVVRTTCRVYGYNEHARFCKKKTKLHNITRRFEATQSGNAQACN